MQRAIDSIYNHRRTLDQLVVAASLLTATIRAITGDWHSAFLWVLIALSSLRHVFRDDQQP